LAGALYLYVGVDGQILDIPLIHLKNEFLVTRLLDKKIVNYNVIY